MDELNGLGGGVDEISLRGGQWFEADRDRSFLGAHDRLAKCLRRPHPCISRGDPIEHVALFGRAEHQDPAPEIRAKIHQITQVLGRLLTNGGVRMGQVQSFGLREHPMNAGNGNAGARRRITNSLTLVRGDIGDGFGDGERGDLHGVIAGFGGVGEGVVHFPTLENLVADREFHWRGV